MNNNTELPVNTALAEKTNKLSYSKADLIALLISIAFGYLLQKWGGLFDPDSGSFALTAILIVGSFVFLRLKKIPVSGKSRAFIGLTAVFSFSLILSSSESVKMFAAAYVVLSTIYWIYYTCLVSENGETGFLIDDFIAFNMIKAALAVPFSYMVRIFEGIDAIVTSLSGKGRSMAKKVFMIIGGLCAAAIPTAIVTGLLISADDAFSNAANMIMDFTFDNFFIEFVIFITGIPAGVYLFNVLYGNTHRNRLRAESVANDEGGDTVNQNVHTENYTHAGNSRKNETTTQRLRVASPFVVFASVTPICIVYTLFFLVQSAYFLSPFKNIVPDGYSYAEYARKGFFELCTVSVINIFIIIYITLLTKRKAESKNHAIKAYVIVISAYTLVMIVIAMSKMAMYINAYGLTIMRIYPTWFMILLTAIFIFIIVRQFKEFKLFRCIFAVFVVLFAMLIFVDLDSITANYNIDRYLDGTLESVDVNMIRFELSDSAVPALLKLLDHKDPHFIDTVEDAVYERYSQSKEQKMNFPNFNFSSYLMIKKIEASPKFDKTNAIKLY